MSDHHAFEVLRQLGDGRFHSGEEIAQALGCSRTLVWQAVHLMQQEWGLTVYSVRGHGYKLATPFEWLDCIEIRDGLTFGAAQTFSLNIIDKIDSTNSQLMIRASEGAPHGVLLAAEQQLAGRGRLGRRWVMPLGAGLTFSLLWRFDRVVSQLAGLSLAVGVAIVRALHSVGADVQLKWPNDIVVNGKKLAGILIELSGDALEPAAVVIGIGINVFSPGEVDQPVAWLSESAAPASRNRLLSALLNELHDVLTVFNVSGFKPFQQEWTKYCFHQDRPVLLSFTHSDPIEGVACGVNEHGALLVDTVTGMKSFHVGEVSLRSVL